MLASSLRFDEEIVLPFRVDVQLFVHNYLQLISGKKMGPCSPSMSVILNPIVAGL
jgi:hypothetical protein